MIDELRQTFETQAFDVFVGALHRRVQHLGVCLVDGQVVERAAADALMARLVELVRGGVLVALAERPGDALRVLDVLRNAGVVELEDARPGCESTQARLHPPPPAVTWREIAELHALAVRHPEHCQLGPPVRHVEFAARLAALGSELPGELLALYAACGHIALVCRHVDATAVRITAGDALRVRDGRLILIDRVRRHPRTMLVEQPAMSIAQALGTWWLVLEDERAPATRRPLDLQSLLRFALLRMAAPSLDVLLTDLAWRRFFT
ncbi:MAG TPA: hypothetical protein VH165_04475 [Kofleriaceae bacterium]|nr:hypothetical protein [Kofleriaceae bacterium]